MKKYKPGDKVTIKSREWYDENKDENGNIAIDCSIFSQDMADYCCKIFEINANLDIDNWYNLKNENHFVWHALMFEETEEKYEPELKLGDVLTAVGGSGEVGEPADNVKEYNDKLDYFAGCIIQGVISREKQLISSRKADIDYYTNRSYGIATAMMKERENWIKKDGEE